ncbi:hypothetical protein DYB30_013823 [Aphanomyces astaci]|uniref:DhaK domain-containing protein n=1 Tax=Aphanomyces astaci TaxID=112090 RepID=A0A397DPP2_APHAT|nr:hypothetical protein DYB30_013823 [Aphanomyces astaci]
MTTAFKMINSPTSVVDEMLRGLVHSSPDLCLVPDYRIVLHRDYNDLKQRQVTLLSGGGSGHEPAHAGYIGHGMLTGVICGDVFASPSTKQVLTAIRLAAGPHGCLIIVKNYTGDRLNFGLAIETAKAEGLNVDMVVIGDDLAIPDAKAGHRGLAGTVFVHKVAGAMAAQGFPLAKIAEQLQQLVIGTMGVAWNSCTLPGQSSSRHIQPHEMEIGLGIHGEPGARTVNQLQSRATVAELLTTVQKGLGITRTTCLCLFDPRDVAAEVGHDRVVVMVNNLGSTTSMELQVIMHDVRQYCVAQQLVVERVAVGSFMTALDMSGFSLTLWKLSAEQATAQLGWLDTPVTAAAWPARLGRFTDDNVVDVHDVAPAKPSSPSTLTISGELLKRAIYAATQSIIQAEADLTDWDTKVLFYINVLVLVAQCGYTNEYTNWSTQLDGVAAVAKAASAGADATKRIAAHDAFGRTSYVGEEAVKNIPDPGAMAVAVWIQALVPHLQTE